MTEIFTIQFQLFQITADKDKVEVSFILCAVYLLLGMALIAMCFNLMQVSSLQ